MSRVLVCGGRTYDNRKVVGRVLRDLHEADPITCIIQGGANGADYLGKLWGEHNGLAVIEVRANWNRFGKRAGHVRNGWMIEHGRPDVVVAFPGGPGTADMVRQAQEHGLRVINTEGIPASLAR